jgi:hypothetical protein
MEMAAMPHPSMVLPSMIPSSALMMMPRERVLPRVHPVIRKPAPHRWGLEALGAHSLFIVNSDKGGREDAHEIFSSEGKKSAKFGEGDS